MSAAVPSNLRQGLDGVTCFDDRQGLGTSTVRMRGGEWKHRPSLKSNDMHTDKPHRADRHIEEALAEMPIHAIVDAIVDKQEDEKRQARFHSSSDDWRFVECKASLVLAYLYPLQEQLRNFPSFQEWRNGARPEGFTNE